MKKQKKQKDALVTQALLKETLDERFEQFYKRLEIYLDHRFKPLEAMAEDYYKFKDYVIDKLDWLVGKYQKFEDEHLILTTRYTDVSRKIDNHEIRITKLEKKTN